MPQEVARYVQPGPGLTRVASMDDVRQISGHPRPSSTYPTYVSSACVDGGFLAWLHVGGRRFLSQPTPVVWGREMAVRYTYVAVGFSMITRPQHGYWSSLMPWRWIQMSDHRSTVAALAHATATEVNRPRPPKTITLRATRFIPIQGVA